jgi:peroxiredoxin
MARISSHVDLFFGCGQVLIDGQVGVPGAFTGTCHAQVPGYIDGFADFQAKGVNRIYIVAVNDVFVTKCVAHSCCDFENAYGR